MSTRHSLTTDMQVITADTDLAGALAFIEAQEGDCYGYHVRQFTDFLRERGALDRSAIVDYFTELNGSTYGAGTKRIKRQAVKKRLRQMARAGGLGSEMSVNLDQFLTDLDREGVTKAPKIQPAPIERAKFITPAEYDRVLAACRGCKQSMLIRFLWMTGCRVSELIGIRYTDCKAESDRVLINVVGKGNKQRTVRIPGAFYDEVVACYHGVAYLFESAGGKQLNRRNISETIAAVTQRALGRTLRAHALRHSFATRQIRRTGKIEAVSRYLGHSSPSITMSFYCHESLDDGELFDVGAA